MRLDRSQVPIEFRESHDDVVTCTRNFVGMNNAYFRLFSVFESDCQKEMSRFCKEFDLVFSITDNGGTIQFRNS